MGAENLSTQEGLLKRRYVGTTEQLVPSFGILQKKFKFDSANKVGDRYEVHVRTANPHGVTAAGGNALGTAFTLNAARAGQTKPAYVKPFELILREQIAYGLVSLASNTETAYSTPMDETVKAMVQTARAYQEMACLYGGQNIGVIESYTGSGTTRAWVISKASWGAGIWSQMQGAALDVYDDDVDGGNKVNANALVSVVSVNASTRTINVSGNSTDLTDIDTASGTLACVKPVGFDGNWGLGVSRILQHTSGTIFDIDPASHGLWKAHQYSVDGKLTFSHILNAAAGLVGNGGMCDITLLVSHWTFTDLSTDSIEFKRVAEADGMAFKAGAKTIELEGPQGTIKIERHPMVKAGEALGICEEQWVRVGSTDLTWNLPIPGMAEKFIHTLENVAGFELRNYQCITPFCHKLAQNFVMTGIVNASL
jgi:hypothetical protein